MILDFQEKLADYVDELKLGIPLFYDSNDGSLSLSVYSLPGGKTIESYMDGTKDKQMNYEFQGKAKKENERSVLNDALLQLAQALENLEPLEIKSENNSFEFMNILNSSEPYFDGETTEGFIYFRFTFQATLKIYKEG